MQTVQKSGGEIVPEGRKVSYAEMRFYQTREPECRQRQAEIERIRGAIEGKAESQKRIRPIGKTIQIDL